MRFSGVLTVVAIGLAVVPSGFAADSIAWGTPVNGLRLGAAFGSDPSKPTIRVVFQNVSGQDQDVLLGYQNGRDPAYNLKFIAKARDGKLREGVELAAYYPVEGLVQPIPVVLSSVRTYELVFPLKNILFLIPRRIEGRRAVTDTLETLLKSGCSVRVSFEAGQGEPIMGGTLPHRWVGKLESTEISQAR